MNLFKKKEKLRTASLYPMEKYEPVLRSSICTGEQTACMMDRVTGKLHEVMVIRNSQDLKQFAEEYGVNLDTIRTVY